MRSKLSTRSRLAAHILALILLIIMLFSIAHPPPGASIPPAPAARQSPVAAPSAPAGPAASRPEITGPQLAGSETVEEGSRSLVISDAPLHPPEKIVNGGNVSSSSAPVAETGNDAPAAKPSEPEKTLSEPAPALPDAKKPESTAPAPQSMDTPPEAAKPTDSVPAPTSETAAGSPTTDESGSPLMTPETEPTGKTSVLAPLANGANLEVLGDGVYWLDPRHDLKKELAAVPEIGTLILLAPLPGLPTQGFEHIKTEVISADAADLGQDAAARFIHLASTSPKPVVAAALPGAVGAAFFKGAYLLVSRGQGTEKTLEDIKPELAEAGSAAEEIVHRLLRLDPAELE